MRMRLFAFSATVLLAAAPPTRRDNVRELLHGVEVVDPYRWLEDQNSPETRVWIETQNRYTRSLLDTLPGREATRRRLAGLTRVDEIQMPVARGGRYFFRRRAAGQEQFVILMRQGLTGKDEVLVDPHSLSKDASVSAGVAAVSDDGKLLAYWIREGGEDERRIRFLDVTTRKHLPDELAKARIGSLSFRKDKSALFYSLSGGDQPRVYERSIGRPHSEDREVFGQGYGAKHILRCDVSEDGRYLLIHVYYGAASDLTEIHLKDLQAGGPVRALVKGVKASLQGRMAGDRLILWTNHQAPNWRVVSVDPKHPQPEHWKELIPEGRAVLSGVSLAGGRIFAEYLDNVQPKLKVFSSEGKLEREIRLPALGSVSDVQGQWDSPEAFFRFVSFHIPEQIYRVDVATGSEQLWSRTQAPVRSEDFEVRQVWYGSRDGAQVPMFLFHKKGLKPTGDNPVLLTGYGGFNLASTPSFRPAAVSWAEQGGIYALANLRGGNEFGEEWRRAGMRDKKQNVFDDFIAAAEWLIREKYTNPKRLAIAGNSNGGLLVGAALTQRPDLFQAVICQYPLLDMIRYHRFLVARFWVPEYGSSDDPEQFKYLLAYSPYHNVKPGTKYPAVMLVTGDADTRVAPLHARKMAALLQASTAGDRPVLLHYDTQAGHSVGLAAARQIENNLDVLSFLFWQLGVGLR